MRLSAKSEYGIRAMVVLAFYYDKGPLPLREIAERESISLRVLEQIFLKLRRSGLVDSIRGMRGGYMLSRPPQEIFVGDIVRALEGPIVPVDCLTEGEGGRRRCIHIEGCFTRQMWERLRDRINDLLNQVSLDDMMKGDILC